MVLNVFICIWWSLETIHVYASSLYPVLVVVICLCFMHIWWDTVTRKEGAVLHHVVPSFYQLLRLQFAIVCSFDAERDVEPIASINESLLWVYEWSSYHRGFPMDCNSSYCLIGSVIPYVMALEKSICMYCQFILFVCLFNKQHNIFSFLTQYSPSSGVMYSPAGSLLC